MKNIIYLLVLMSIVTTQPGCLWGEGNKKSDVPPGYVNPFGGAWVYPCTDDGVNSYDFEYSVEKTTKRVVYFKRMYEGLGCDQWKKRIITSVSYDMEVSGSAAEGAKVDLKVTRADYSLITKELADEHNSVKACGFENWIDSIAGKRVEGVDCLNSPYSFFADNFYPAGTVLYDFWKASGDKLYIGHHNGDPRVEANRPTSVYTGEYATKK